MTSQAPSEHPENGRPPIRDTVVRLLQPCVNWPRWNGKTLRTDIESAAIGALIAVPQAIALAALAGLPPQYGIYASVLPVLIAVLWGSSWHLVSGPNTAVSLMLAAAVAPLAGTSESAYLSLILLLTFMTGAAQLATGLLRLGSILNFVSNTVIVAVTHAVAVVMIVSAVATVVGAETGTAAPFFVKIWRLLQSGMNANPWTLAVGMLVVAVGLISRIWWRRYALFIALVAGTLAVYFWNRYGVSEDSRIALLGGISLAWSPWSAPPVGNAALSAAADLAGSALAIAFVGLMQSVVIARSLARKSGQRIDPNRECVGQGLANLSAPFMSAFAGSGSFNRSATHLQLGARSPLAVVYSALILLVLVVAAHPLLERIPQVAVAATLILVGLGLIDLPAIRRIGLSRQETLIFSGALGVSLLFGLTEGVLAGVLLSLVVYLGKTSAPGLEQYSYIGRDGRTVTAISIHGNLFFGSVPAVEPRLPLPAAGDPRSHVLLLRTEHLTYLDIPGAELLLRQVRRWREAGGDAYVSIAKPEQLSIFKSTGLLPVAGADCMIRRDRNHDMKEILNPYASPASLAATSSKVETTAMHALARRLHTLPLFGPVPIHRLTALLEGQPILSAEPGDIIVRPEETLNEHVVLLEGELEAQRTWPADGGFDKSYSWTLKPDPADNRPAILTAASRRLRARAVTNIRFMRIDANHVDELLGWKWQAALSGNAEDQLLQKRMSLVRQAGVFRYVPLERLHEAFARMRPVPVGAGETVIREGEKGDRYFVIEEGEAEVIRTDPLSGETRIVDRIGAGDCFGEESLLQDGFRNATIRMLTPGIMLALTRDEFEALVRPSLLEEVDAETARSLMLKGETRLLDCRYDLEYEDVRLPGAQLIPLHTLRDQAHKLDTAVRYVVYCRSGRRSRAAAFLLKERNINAVSLKGGIKDWPFELDALPLTDPA